MKLIYTFDFIIHKKFIFIIKKKKEPTKERDEGMLIEGQQHLVDPTRWLMP